MFLKSFRIKKKSNTHWTTHTGSCGVVINRPKYDNLSQSCHAVDIDAFAYNRYFLPCMIQVQTTGWSENTVASSTNNPYLKGE